MTQPLISAGLGGTLLRQSGPPRIRAKLMAGKPNKTQAGKRSVDDFLIDVQPDKRRDDARNLCALMGRLSNEPPVLWGPSIIGFGTHRYKYESGREGETMKVGFSPRKPALVLYGLGIADEGDILKRLGKVTTGKGCVYIKSLDDINMAVLEDVIVAALKRRTN
jgi:hypothetical protein